MRHRVQALGYSCQAQIHSATAQWHAFFAQQVELWAALGN